MARQFARKARAAAGFVRMSYEEMDGVSVKPERIARLLAEQRLVFADVGLYLR